MGIMNIAIAMLVTANPFAFAAPVDVYGNIGNTTPATNLTSTTNATPGGNGTSVSNATNTLTIFDWLFNPTSGTVNFFSRDDCLNPCVDTMFCSSGSSWVRGDLANVHWNVDTGVCCWDIPAGTQSIGLVANKGTSFDAYAGTNWDCKSRLEAIEGKRSWDRFETTEIGSGQGDGSKMQACNYGGVWMDDLKSVVWIWDGDK